MQKVKRKSLIVLIIAFMLSMVAFGVSLLPKTVSAATNIIANGNFASNGANWTATGVTLDDDDNFIAANKSGAKSGKALYVRKIDTSAVTIVSDNINIAESGTYTFNFRYRTSLITNGGDIGSVYLASGGTKIDGTETKILATNQVWQSPLYDYTLSQTENLTVNIVLNGIRDSEVSSRTPYVDYYLADFTLVKTEPVIKNGHFDDGADGWTLKNIDKNITAATDYLTFGVVDYSEYSSYAGETDNGKAYKFVRKNTAEVVNGQYLIQLYASLNTKFVAGYDYKISYKVWSNGGSTDGATYLVLGKNIIGASNGTGKWEEKTFTYSCESGGEEPTILFRLVYPTAINDNEMTVLFTDLKAECQPKSENVELTNGEFKNVTSNYPEEWGILSGSASVSNGALTMSNEDGVSRFGASFFSSVYEGSNHYLTLKVKTEKESGTVRDNLKVIFTSYSDKQRTLVTNNNEVTVNMSAFYENISTEKLDSWNKFEVPYTAPVGAKFVDVSIVCDSDVQDKFEIKEVSFGLSDEESRNFGFDVVPDGSDKPLNWTITSGDLSVSTETRPDSEGVYSAKIGGNYAGGQLVSAAIELEKCAIDNCSDRHHYVLSYWIKTVNADFSSYVNPQVVLWQDKDLKNASKIVVYGSKENPGDGLKPYTQAIQNVNYSSANYATYGSTVTDTNPEGWVYQRLSFEVADDSNYCVLKFIFTGAGEDAYVLIDDISINVDHSEPNLDFEYADADGNPRSWYLAQAFDSNPQMKVVDDVYHSGNHSLYLNLDTTVSNQYLNNPSLLAIDPSGINNVYEVSFWVASRNSDVKSVQLDVWYHGADGVKIYSRTVSLFTAGNKGTVKSLNSGSTMSEWSKVITRVPIETMTSEIEIKYISLNFVFTNGKAEVWLDDISVYQAESDTYVTNFAQDAHAVDDDGNVSGWKTLDADGKTLSDITLAQNDCTAYEEFYDVVYAYDKCVTMPKDANAYLVTETTTLFSEYQYKLTVIYKSDYELNLKIKALDQRRKEYENTELTETFTKKGCWTQQTFLFTAASATYTQFWLDNGGQGEFSVALIRVEQVGKPSSAGTWYGQWVTYKDDFRYSDEYCNYYFRGYVELNPNKTVVYAPLQLTGDDKVALWVNGNLVVDGTESSSDTWASIKVVKDVSQYLKQGEKNILAFKVYNASAYMALLYDGIWKYDDGEEFHVVSDKNVRVLNENDFTSDEQEAAFLEEWTNLDHDDTDDSSYPWGRVYVKGTPPASPWGGVYYDSSLYIDSKIEVKVVEGEGAYVGDLVYKFVLDIKPEKAFTSNIAMTMSLCVRNSTKVVCDLTPTLTENGDMKKWVEGEWNRVAFTVNLPDYLESGTYTLQLTESYFIITSSDIYDNKFINFEAGNNYVPVELETKVEKINGVPTYTVNGEPKAAFWYIYSPNGSKTSLSQADKLATETILNFDLSTGEYEGTTTDTILWQESGAINFERIDSKLNTMLAASPNANVIVTLSFYAPDWWLDKHEGQVTAHIDENNVVSISNGSQVSACSTAWRDDCTEVIGRIIEHMREQTYYAKVAGFKIAAGGTAENIIFDSQSEIYTPDYSQAAIDYFRNWAKETYETIENLRIVWNDPTIESFETIQPPNADELREDPGTYGVYDPVTQQKLIDWRGIVGVATADYLTTWAKAIKDATDNKLIVGCYYGYLWAGTAYGVATQKTDEIYACEYIDFFCSPQGYNERQLGEGIYSESVSDSVRAYGKLFIHEQDNRTCLTYPFAGSKWNQTTDFSVGVTHTFSDTILQLKRDTAYNICNGNGQWIYDMQGGWYNDQQLQEMTEYFNDEFNYYNYVEKDLTNDIALVINDSNVEYSKWSLQSDGDGIMLSGVVRSQYSFKWARKHLDKMGAGYDVYATSTIVDSVDEKVNCTVPDYKVYIFINPITLTKTEREAIEKHCKKKGSICIFLMESGWGYNTDDLSERLTSDKIGYSESNMTDLTGFNIKVSYEKSAGQVMITDNGSAITSGLNGQRFGAQVSSTRYFLRKLWVEDDGSASYQSLGVLADDTSKTGFAMKKMPAEGGGEWISIWCAAPYLSQEVLRGIIAYTNTSEYAAIAGEDKGIHSYVKESDSDLIVWSNSAYVGAHSATSGIKRLYLEKNYAAYDVYEQAYATVKYDETNGYYIEYYNEENDTHLFRLSEPNTYSVLVRVSGGHGSILEVTADGTTAVGQVADYVAGGASKTYTITPDEGYVVKSVTINGEEIVLDENNSFTLSDIKDSLQVVVTFKREAVEQYVEDWQTDEKLFEVPNWLIAIISVAVIGGLVWLIVYKNFLKKGVRK